MRQEICDECREYSEAVSQDAVVECLACGKVLCPNCLVRHLTKVHGIDVRIPTE